MIIMPSNHSCIHFGRMCGIFPHRFAWLAGPGHWKRLPSWMSLALDNGAYGAWEKKTEWDEIAWWVLVLQATMVCNPLWAVVPDVVTDREATIRSWGQWYPVMRDTFPNLPLAFAVQDGMTPDDVPPEADIVFVGGSFDWKWDNLHQWTNNFPKVHVARVNTEKRLWLAHEAGAVSCDGTGWFRGGEERFSGLLRYLEESEKEFIV